MRFIIEFDGPVFDIAPLYYQAHRNAATEVGWSRLDQGTFWRLTRKDGQYAAVLPGASPAKMKSYYARFLDSLETDAAVESCQPHPEMDGTLAGLARYGASFLVTTGENIAARREVVERFGLSPHFEQVEKLNGDPRRRPAELRALAGNDERAVVVAAGEAVIRAAGFADLLAVGIACGACAQTRLHQAGVDVLFRDLGELGSSLRTGGSELIRAGLLPFPPG